MPALDGLRALAITMVFLEHFGGGAHGGWVLQIFNRLRENLWMGVDLFFVLSGFLITGILYDTQNDSKFFKRFFARRAIRIFPVYYGVLLLIVLAAPLMHYQLHWLQLTFLVYLGNFFGNANWTLYEITSPVHPTWMITIGHLWSLCVEEQFYLVWPIVVWLVRERVKLLCIAVVGCVLALLLRVGMQFIFGPVISERWVVRTIFFRADALLMGAALALVLRGANAATWQRYCKGLFCVAGVMMVGVFLLPADQTSPWVFTIGLSLTALTSTGLIGMAVHPETATYCMFSLRPLRVIGKYSYGFYVFHYLFLWAWIQLFLLIIARVHSMLLAGFIYIPLAYGTTFLVSKLSYDFYESWFLRLKKYFQYDVEISKTGHQSVI